MKDQEKADKLVKDHFLSKMSESLKTLRRLATYDLWYGPVPEGEDCDGAPWVGFSKAMTELRKFADENLNEVWVDIDSENVLDKEPEAFWTDPDTGEEIEEYLENTYHYEFSDVMKAVFPNQLHEYF